ncbi:hypothetical protein [Flavobacterium seoulense]|uniref:Lipoprotein n=1 Tax=Flavobacterium seoulense TaxID=1492738 RepID=A0A066WNL7_9FLAO|nr:hypothetical protein [Flavobacterium seoulense]KDN54193.1 hypothetical protein FEM21_26590 [Flavobacterium seoulense]
MNRIKIISVLSIVIAIIVSCSKDDYKLDTKSVDPFVRFNFLTTSAGVPLEYPAVSTTRIPVTTYENKSIKTLKIPVALSSPTLKEDVRVNFSTVTSGDTNVFSIEPTNELLFGGNKLTDTIFVSFDKRWTKKDSITLKLEGVSDSNIHIGNLNTSAANDNFTINLGDLKTTYSFPVNQLTLKGEVGEKIDFKVNFSNGFIPSEIENLPIFNFSNGFDYSLTHDDYGDNRNSITYHLTLLENLKNDDFRYETKIGLIDNVNYTKAGNSILRIVKPTKIPRDIQTNPASNFSNLATPFYLTYLEQWFDKSGTCAWQPSTTLTFPVIVDKDAENAIQYSGQNTADTSDDVYIDAFKIGFNTATGDNTVNSFALKRWITGANSKADISPGFNITSALEFFPENGNSKTSGKVLVIPQDITIGISKEKNHIIAIEGEGTYKETSPGLFEIAFELKLTNEALFKGTVSTQYRMYNYKAYTKPTPLNINCPKPEPINL